MKDKAIELLSYSEIWLDKCDIEFISKLMLEFGYYVAEKQKEQILKENYHSRQGREWILNSKNVCEQ